MSIRVEEYIRPDGTNPIDMALTHDFKKTGVARIEQGCFAKALLMRLQLCFSVTNLKRRALFSETL
jgi:hypothetical protein